MKICTDIAEVFANSKHIQMVKAKYIAVVLLLVWILSMIYMTFTVNNSSGGGWGSASSNIQNDLLDKSLREVERLKQENIALRKKIDRLRLPQLPEQDETEVSVETVTVSAPSKQHEILRRRVATDIREAWYFMRHRLSILKKDLKDHEAESTVDDLLGRLFEYHSVTSNDLELLSAVDGTDHWRRKESRELAEVVGQVLEKLQNPTDCLKRKLLLCNLGKGCGFGCQVHHLTYCLITSVATNRTMVIDSRHWRYLDNGWFKFFEPPSRTCNFTHALGAVSWGAETDSARVVLLPIIDTINPHPDFLPLAVPEQLAERLTRLHGDPFVWWAGQMVGYLMRPQSTLREVIEENSKKLKFASGKGVVGVHIRRTDKVAAEAAFHSLEEYMKHVERYFDAKDLGRDRPVKRSVYLASDDPNVFAEIASKYPQYFIYGNKDFSETASLHSRYTEASLRAVILDIYFLSRCDHLVCTFSSQVCRLAYELMQTMHGDASDRFVSLDDIYYFGGQSKHLQVARLGHAATSETELTLEKGDHVMVAGNHWDGYSMGTLDSFQGLYPSFKVIEKLMVADFPVFNEYLPLLALNSSSPLFPPSSSTKDRSKAHVEVEGQNNSFPVRSEEAIPPVIQTPHVPV